MPPIYIKLSYIKLIAEDFIAGALRYGKYHVFGFEPTTDLCFLKNISGIAKSLTPYEPSATG